MSLPGLGHGLYGMLDLPSPPAPTAPPRKIYEPLFAAGISVLQLRMKNAGAAAMLAVLEELRAHRPPNTLLIVNDQLDVALAGHADGVHLGQDDLPLAAALRLRAELTAAPFIIGISTHNEQQASAALQGGADYIAFGPIYTTSSKANPDPIVGIARLAALCRSTTRPVVAIGGITLDRVSEVVAAGAHCAAIISAVNQPQGGDIFGAARAVQAHFHPPADAR